MKKVLRGVFVQPLNSKRKIRPVATDTEALARRVSYGGNPEHKRNPGDFGLNPPAAHRRTDKSLCDGVGILSRKTALKLLRAGIRKGLISVQERDGWPRNVWSVTAEGEPLEAELENSGQGCYHGYPMPQDDPFRNQVLEQWQTG